ncbi:hypothetical protein GL213_14390 [Halogeometricum borinquense]|uniref:Uncharacterized protein n=2 Tax=Halogeometricum borinquense TaxID=60847 RepID=E4NME3_HALBP|nr:hypothetical protein [Halogeometricum borinquense]ADQ68441.1 hypothetical protein Hbor_29020 [Halogeometricum borinquense DSM 11551]QIB75716.1 hypothetical protein G3I44_16355 [Halogeometricum borinquense]QIQ77605.1 hypothetical protein GL213_14390 [Halogeometricum borinquense]RYJ15026.1 hypothetical protein ELS19_14415 [Halogeometricum borinquense]
MRHPATILLFIVCVAGVGGAMTASGTADWLGMQPDTGVQDDVAQSKGDLKDYSASRGSSDTSFIGATISGTDEVVSSFVLIYALADMLVNAGLPSWGAVMIASPLTWSMGLFVIYMFTGRSGVRPR